MKFRSGFISIVGRPNVGKSTLLNAIMGEKISIMSPKPQTTRNNIKAILTEKDYQIIFIDTPGIHKPRTKLGEYMVNSAEKSIGEVDACLFLIDAQKQDKPSLEEEEIIENLKRSEVPVIFVINKIDLIVKEEILSIIAEYSKLMEFSAIVPISAAKKKGIKEVVSEILKLLPEGPVYYTEDISTDQPVKLMAAEIIREKILKLTNDEVPHGTGVEIISFKTRPGGKIIDIDATIYCEKNSHKAIIIGKNGAKLKQIGTYAREECEKLLAAKVNLQLWVKVKDDWRNSPSMLKTLGYKEEK